MFGTWALAPRESAVYVRYVGQSRNAARPGLFDRAVEPMLCSVVECGRAWSSVDVHGRMSHVEFMSHVELMSNV